MSFFNLSRWRDCEQIEGHLCVVYEFPPCEFMISMDDRLVSVVSHAAPLNSSFQACLNSQRLDHRVVRIEVASRQNAFSLEFVDPPSVRPFRHPCVHNHQSDQVHACCQATYAQRQYSSPATRQRYMEWALYVYARFCLRRTSEPLQLHSHQSRSRFFQILPQARPREYGSAVHIEIG